MIRKQRAELRKMILFYSAIFLFFQTIYKMVKKMSWTIDVRHVGSPQNCPAAANHPTAADSCNGGSRMDLPAAAAVASSSLKKNG